MAKILITVVTILGISGCVQRQYVPTQSEVNRSNMVATENAAQRNFSNCLDSLRSSEQNPKILAAFSLVDREVYFEKSSSPNKLELMTSNSKLNDKQKIALLEVISVSQKCSTAIKADLKSLPTLAVTYENYYGDMEVVHAQLIGKKITIGEANTQKSQLQLKAKTAYTAAISNLENNSNAAISREQQARQAEDMQRRALASQYLMNQQAINAQQQINQQNQINNNRPVQTNCYKIGNSVNCTSQ